MDDALLKKAILCIDLANWSLVFLLSLCDETGTRSGLCVVCLCPIVALALQELFVGCRFFLLDIRAVAHRGRIGLCHFLCDSLRVHGEEACRECSVNLKN